MLQVWTSQVTNVIRSLIVSHTPSEGSTSWQSSTGVFDGALGEGGAERIKFSYICKEVILKTSEGRPLQGPTDSEGPQETTKDRRT